MKRNQPAPSPPGFTLAEILIVLLVASIAAAVAVSRLGLPDAPNRLRRAAEMLLADLAYAQIESISHGDDLRLMRFDTSNHGYHLAASSSPLTPITNPVGGGPYSVRFGQGAARFADGVQLGDLSLGGDSALGFGAYGELDQDTVATVTLACQGYSLTISVDPVSGEAVVGAVN